MRMTPVTLADLRAAIQAKSGGPMRIGDKGLIYSTTALEAHLSKTTAPWPGDADLVVFDADDHEPRCVIELKKHTERSRLPFGRQQVENYASPGGPDQRKYDRLSLLAEQVSASGPLPLYTLYYSTVRGQDDLRLERVTRDGVGGFRGRPVATISQRTRLPTQVLETLYAATWQDALAHPPATGVRAVSRRRRHRRWRRPQRDRSAVTSISGSRRPRPVTARYSGTVRSLRSSSIIADALFRPTISARDPPDARPAGTMEPANAS